MSPLTALQAFLVYIYVGTIWTRFGVLRSISASTYHLEGMKRWLFWGWLTAIGGLNLFQGMGGWGFGVAAGLLFAGITIEHKRGIGLEDELHSIGTVFAIICAFMSLASVGIWWPAAVMLVGSTILASYTRNKIWWIELLAFALVIVGYTMR